MSEKKKYKYVKKLNTEQIQNKYCDDKWLNKKKQKYENWMTDKYRIELVELRRKFAGTTKIYRVAAVIMWWCLSCGGMANSHYEQVAYIAETNVKNVEKAVMKLKVDKFIEHEVSHNGHQNPDNLKKWKCNPFKYGFKLLKIWTHRMLRNLKYVKSKWNKLPWFGDIKKVNVNFNVQKKIDDDDVDPNTWEIK